MDSSINPEPMDDLQGRIAQMRGQFGAAYPNMMRCIPQGAPQNMPQGYPQGMPPMRPQYGPQGANPEIPPRAPPQMVGQRMPTPYNTCMPSRPLKAGGIAKMAKGGSVSSASKRADGIAAKGKTKGKYL